MCQYLDDSIKQDCEDKTKNEWKIIEVGAGTGLLGLELHELGYNVLHALDISAEMLNEAKKKNVYKKFICASLSDQRIPEIDTGEYDALICVGTLFRGHARSSAFLEMIRMVRIGKTYSPITIIFNAARQPFGNRFSSIKRYIEHRLSARLNGTCRQQSLPFRKRGSKAEKCTVRLRKVNELSRKHFSVILCVKKFIKGKLRTHTTSTGMAAT